MQTISVRSIVGSELFGLVRLAASRVVEAQHDVLRVFSPGGAHVIAPGWAVDAHALSPCGSYLVATGEAGRRVSAWDLATGRCVFAIGDSEQRRGALTGAIATVGDDVWCLTTSRANKSELAVHSLSRGEPVGVFATSAVIGFTVLDVRSLGGPWLGVRGHSDGDQYDTVVAMDATGVRLLALQDALVDQPSVKQWGYRVAIGPASPLGAVVYRDAEWSADDPPDDPNEAFVGFEIWDLRASEVVQRIAYEGPVPLGTEIGADEDRIAVMMTDHVLVVRRDGSGAQRIPAVALDPFRLELAYRDGGELIVAPIGPGLDE